MKYLGEIDTYGKGLCYVSVCAPKEASMEEVAAAADRDWPTGLDHNWALSSEGTFRTGETNPCPCNDFPEERVHYLLSC